VDRDRAALNRLPGWLAPALAAIPVVGLAVFYLWPLATLLARVVQPGSVSDALHTPGLGRVLWFTFWQAVASTIATMVVGFAPAYLLARFRFHGRGALLAIVTVPFMLPTVVVGAAFLALLPDAWHGTAQAVIVAHVFFNIAVVVRLVGAMWAVLPTDLTAAARTLGAAPAQVLRFVVLPLLRPALWAAATVVFLFTFTSFGAVKLLGGSANPTLEVEIARRATQLGDVDGAAVLSLLQLLVLGMVVWWTSRWQRRASVHLTGGGAGRVPRARHERRFVVITGVSTAILMVVPMVVLVSRSFRLGGAWSLHAWRTLGSSEVRPGVSLGVDPLASLLTSLRFAAVGEDRVHRQRGLDRAERADARVDALELDHDRAVGDRVHARAAVALDRAAEEAHVGELGDQLAREGPGLVVLLDDREDPALAELAGRLPGQPLFLGQQVVDAEQVGPGVGGHARHRYHDPSRISPLVQLAGGLAAGRSRTGSAGR